MVLSLFLVMMLNIVEIVGVIPRAASALFNKLGGVLPNMPRSGSGLRTPTRYSMASVASLPKAAEKDWVMKATYVEVRPILCSLDGALYLTLARFTMSNFAICCCQNPCLRTSATLLLSVKIQKAVSCSLVYTRSPSTPSKTCLAPSTSGR